MTFSVEVTLTFTTGENQLLVVSYRLLVGRGTGDYGTLGGFGHSPTLPEDSGRIRTCVSRVSSEVSATFTTDHP